MALAQWSLEHDAVMALEYRLGRQTLQSGESRDGATRFAEGVGRHGAF